MDISPENTPLLNALLDHIRLTPAPFHMPGHKGRMGAFEDMASMAALDVTELPDTGNLYEGVDPYTGELDPIAQAEGLWADAWGFPNCQFLTCGSTQGLHAALLLCAQEKGAILVDRCSHRSVYNALAMWDMWPMYLMRRQDEPLAPQLLEGAFKRMEAAGHKATSVCITSPTYYGVLSDIPALAQIAHAHGAKLIVDGAHGCHLPFLQDENPFKGADLVVSSAHKTLPVYGQGALLFGSDRYTPRDLRWAASVCGTSSPSYPIMASMDYARAWAQSPQGLRDLQGAVAGVEQLRREFVTLTMGDLENRALDPKTLAGAGLDPMRLTLLVDANAADGYQVKEYLEAMGIFPEMADRDHVVLLLSPQNTDRDIERLRKRLKEAQVAWPQLFGMYYPLPDPPGPHIELSPAMALKAPRILRPLDECVGKVCLQQVAPYPPGVPVIAPGERVTKKGLAYLKEVEYNITEPVWVLDEDKWDGRREQAVLDNRNDIPSAFL